MLNLLLNATPQASPAPYMLAPFSFQERFYFSDNVIPAFVSSISCLLSRLQILGCVPTLEPAGEEPQSQKDGRGEGHQGKGGPTRNNRHQIIDSNVPKDQAIWSSSFRFILTTKCPFLSKVGPL
jgi:hypothetical protein